MCLPARPVVHTRFSCTIYGMSSVQVGDKLLGHTCQVMLPLDYKIHRLLYSPPNPQRKAIHPTGVEMARHIMDYSRFSCIASRETSFIVHANDEYLLPAIIRICLHFPVNGSKQWWRKYLFLSSFFPSFLSLFFFT